MRLPRWLRRLLIMAGILVMLNFIGGMVFDHCICHTRMTKGPGVSIVRHPPAADYSGMHGKMTSIPTYDAGKTEEGWQIDLRSSDLSGFDVKGRENDLLHADFDSKTKWPAGVETLSAFKPDRIMELGRNPGLGVRALHKQGITGKRVGIAIIDQGLLVDHAEYRDRLRMYEEIHCMDGQSQMHGPAVASIAVGKTVGVAPGADLYYIAETHVKVTPLALVRMLIARRGGSAIDFMDFRPLAGSIDRIVEINKGLPRDRKIRVISLSIGWDASQRGGRAASRAVQRAEKDGIFVIYTSLEETSSGKMSFHGLGREPLSDPDKPTSYGPGSWWAKGFYLARRDGAAGTTARLMLPMDSRCTASPTGISDYAFYSNGGWSWVCPYIAGLYALACQVKPSVTPSEFWKAALETGDTVQIAKDGKEYPLGKIANPVKLIARLQAAR